MVGAPGAEAAYLFGRNSGGADAWGEFAILSPADGTDLPVPGLTTTYAIEVGNFGGFDAIGAQVTDAFPAGLTCSWSCVATGAASCTAGPVAGDIDDLIDLPVGETVTFTAVCDIDPAATGSTSNTAAVVAPVATPDPNPANDSATDVNTLDPQTDLVNTASVSSPAGVTELDPVDNTSTHTDEIAAPGDVIFADGFEDGNTWAWD